MATRAVTSHPVKPELYQNVYTDTGTLMKNDVRDPYYEAGLVAFRVKIQYCDSGLHVTVANPMMLC